MNTQVIKSNWISILTVGLALGTAWAVRGQFGHEQGAAWAGGIGALVLLLVSGRMDWYRKVFTVTLSCAIGWGVGGMISYGRVIGYGRSDHFPNVFYGLLMLFVIGALFGLIGGGLTGMALQSSREKKVKWGSLIAEMAAGGAIAYFFLVSQLWIHMTPPRSEAWAVCLGAGLAMLWHMARNNYSSPLRVAIISALGAGFGFSFGNFLQTLGNVLEINFNMWNVMEYSIGFFGGTSMAYSIFTSKWPDQSTEPSKWENRVSFMIMFLLIPLIVFRQSLQYGKILSRLGDIVNESTILASSYVSGSLIILMIIIGWFIMNRSEKSSSRSDLIKLTAVYFGIYIIISYIVTGALAGIFSLNHHLYVVNFVAVVIILSMYKTPVVFADEEPEINRRRWFIYFIGIIAVIFLLTLISINIHDGMPGMQFRFPVDT